MDSGMLTLIEKGGTWTQFLLFSTPIWILSGLIMVIWQRIRLNTLAAHVITEASADDPAESAVNFMRTRLGFFSGGIAGALVVSTWWLLALATFIWSRSNALDISRLLEESYLSTLGSEMTTREAVRLHSSTLITRSMVGIVGIPNLIVTMLFLDQMLFRPQTRFLDQVRRKTLALNPHSQGLEGAKRAIQKRADAGWSWIALYFNWQWLLVKWLPKQMALILVAHLLLGVTNYFLTSAGIIPSTTSPGFQLGVEPRAWEIFWLPVLGGLMSFLPGYFLCLVVAAKAQGWVASKAKV